MGKGDKKTGKGKRFRGSYGNSRPKNKRKRVLKKRRKLTCYNCRIELIPKGKAKRINPKPPNAQTKEHIPQKSLYEGYGEKYKLNRITVAGCHKCNNDLSKIDSEIRDLVGISNEKDQNKIEISKKSAKSILQKGNWKDRVYTDSDGNTVTVEFSYDDLRELHIKNFKGLFQHEFGFTIPHNFVIEIISEGDVEIDAAMGIYGFLELNEGWKMSGHSDIFQYKIVAVKAYKNNNIVVTNNIDKAIAIFGVLDYHKTVLVIVIAAKEGALQAMKSKKRKIG